MSEDLKLLSIDSSSFKALLLKNNIIDILLFLVKYNPKVTVKEIKEKFGEESAKDVESLKRFNLVIEDEGTLTLTEEGIFQVEGLLTLVV